MWVLTSADKKALYNLSAFDVVAAEHDHETGSWFVQAMKRDGGSPVVLAVTDDLQAADDLIAAIAVRVDAMDLGREADL
jgi:hypothetical protein